MGDRSLRFIFKSKKIELLYAEEKGAHKYPPEVVEAFFDKMTIINATIDTRELYSFKSLRFEKLSGGRRNDRSIRLNKQWRLTLRVKEDDNGEFLLILDIEDYHK